jgi:hypothetical protein
MNYMINEKEIFIFTEGYNCGKILNKSLESFFNFHPDYKVNVFGKSKDIKEIKNFIDKIEINDLSIDDTLKNYYNQGHFGTAYIFTKVLKKEFGNYRYVIHFDSDVLFREECLNDIISGFNDGFALVGQRRGYEKNRCNRNDLKGIPDVVGTCFFGIDLNYISEWSFSDLHRMVAGYYNPRGFLVLDFFDPVSFDVIKNNGKIKYLNFNDYGSSDENGNWNNDYKELNTLFDFGKKFIHFAGVGSGMNFINNGSGSVPTTYSDWAKERYSLYNKLFYNENIDFKYDETAYEAIKKEIF